MSSLFNYFLLSCLVSLTNFISTVKIESFNRLPELIFPFLCVQFVNKFYICR